MRIQFHCLILLILIGGLQEVFGQDGDGLGFFVKAEQLRQSNQFRAAIDEYNNAIRDNPTNYKFVFQKGKCYINLRDEENAIAAFERTVEIKEDYVHAYTRLAWLYQRKERFDDAIEAFNKAFKFETNSGDKIEYKSAIIKTLYKLGRFNEAGRHIEDARKVNSSDLSVLFYDAKYNNMNGNYEKAKQSMLKAIASLTSGQPKDVARYYYELGVAYYELGEFTKAFEAFQKADYGPFQNKIAEKTPQYKLAIAKCYFSVFENEKCEKIIDFCLKMKNNFPPAHELKLKLAERKTDKKIIVEHTLNLINSETVPARKAAKYSELAELYIQQKDYDGAINAANEALNIQPTNYKVSYFKLLAMNEKNQHDAAIAEIRNLLSYQGLDFETKAQLNFTLGLIQKDKGDFKSAIKSFKASIYGAFKYAAKEELKEVSEELNTDESEF